MNLTPTPDRPVALTDAAALDPDRVGRKAATLARLLGATFRVPDGLVLPVGLVGRWAPGRPIPTEVAAGIDHIARRFPGPVAVRSSAPQEDLRTLAQAGAFTTVLGVEGTAALQTAVRRCLDSAASRAMAVLVQPMLDPDHAGVAFTIDPSDGDRTVVRLAYTAGLGDALGDGRVVGADVTVRVDGQIRGALQGLPTEQAMAVARLARDVEDLLGGPQDIEWAIVHGEVHLLQARPVTVIPVRPDPPEGNGWEKDVAHYTEPVTPFGWSLLEPIEAAAIGATFPQVGLIMKRFDQRCMGGEVYTRPVLVVGPADPGPNPGGPPPAIVLGIAARLLPALRRRNAAAKRALADDLPQRWQVRWPIEWRPHFVRRATELRAIDPATLDDDELLAHLEDCIAHATHGGVVHFRLMIGYILALHALHRFTAMHLGWDDARTTTLMAGASPASAEGELALAEIRRRMADLDGAADAVRDAPNDPVGALAGLDIALGQALAGWVETYGWRSMNYDPGRPVLAEQPQLLTRLLLARPVSREEDPAAGVIAGARATLDPSLGRTFDQLVDRARALYPVREDNVAWTDGVPGGLLRRWLGEASTRLADRGLLDHRGDGAYLTVDELKEAVAGRPADDLMERVVRRRGEEAYVRANPGPLVIGGAPGTMPDLSALPTPLRTVNEALLWFVGLEYPGDAAAVTGPAVLSGVGASPGVAEGPVRIIRQQSDFVRMQAGEVLVCQVTSPTWASMFGLATAIVADGGGALSHAAIAAREHGLPAVLGTRSATSTLVDGQHVRVDGVRGTVTLVGDDADAAGR